MNASLMQSSRYSSAVTALKLQSFAKSFRACRYLSRDSLRYLSYHLGISHQYIFLSAGQSSQQCRWARSIQTVMLWAKQIYGLWSHGSSVLGLLLGLGADWKILTESQHKEWNNDPKNSFYQRTKIFLKIKRLKIEHKWHLTPWHLTP